MSTALEVETRDTPAFCPGVCEFAAATCELNVPTGGDYHLVLRGSESSTLLLPVTAPVALYADRECP